MTKETPFCGFRVVDGKWNLIRIKPPKDKDNEILRWVRTLEHAMRKPYMSGDLDRDIG